MADSKVSDLAQIDALADADAFYVVDASGASAADKARKTLASQLAAYVLANFSALGRLFAKSVGLWYPLAGSAVAVTAPANTNENILVTVAVPAGAMGPNGRLRVRTVWSYTNSANNKVCKVRFGGIAGAAFHSTTATTTSTAFGSSSLAPVTAAVDTSAAVDLVITAQKASAGETLTLELYTVDVLYRA